MFNIVILHGPTKEFTCDVLIDQWEMGCVELGSGWREFCALHVLREGDKLYFECDSEKPSNNI